MRPVIIVFAKAPVPGRVKTRLIPPLTTQMAVSLHSAFVRDTLESLVSVTERADIELHTDIETDAWPDIRVPRRVQYEGNLGLKMLKALSWALHRGHPRALILGSDSPNLPLSHLEALLDLDTHIALGPAEDGGYFAIAATRVDDEMFNGVRWSTAHALQDTVRACAECGLMVGLGPAWFDVDDASGLHRLAASSKIPRHTARMLETINANEVKWQAGEPSALKRA
jgi:rSAM/selenodomain-associated transferase 1